MRRTVILFSLISGLLFSGVAASAFPAAEKSGIKRKLKELAAQKVKAECGSCTVTVQCKWIAPSLTEASGQSITGLYFEKPGMPAGYATAKVAFNKEPPSAEATVQFYVEVRQKVPVAARMIKKGEDIKERDLVRQWKDLSRLNRRPVTSLENFKEKIASRIIRKGTVFYAADLVGISSIQPGDKVSMQYDKEGIRIAINCIARETKGAGDKIRLYSKETGQRYIAKIINNKKIIWVRTL